MPTRKQFAYLCLALAGGYVAMFVAVLGYVDHVNSQRERASAAAAAAQARQQAQTRKVVCDLANGYLRIYIANPPVTPQQQGVRETWQAMALQFACPAP